MDVSKYYATFSLSKVPHTSLKNEEHANLHIKLKKEKPFEHPKIIVWKASAVHQADLCQIPLDSKGFNYFLNPHSCRCSHSKFRCRTNQV